MKSDKHNLDYLNLIKEKMYDHDAFSKWLGIELIEISRGYSKIGMKVRPEMLNGFFIAHGGICYSLADSALAFASNTLGQRRCPIETSISHIKPIKSGQYLTAIAESVTVGKTLARFTVNIVDDNDKKLAVFHGTVFFIEI